MSGFDEILRGKTRSREFEPSSQAIRNWVAQADREEGRREAKPSVGETVLPAAGLAGACHRGNGPLTTRRDKEGRPAPDLVDRKFTVEGPDQLWVADITFVPTMTGFLYLAAFGGFATDCFADGSLRGDRARCLEPQDRRLVGSHRTSAMGARRWPIIFGPNWYWTRLAWPWASDGRAT